MKILVLGSKEYPMGSNKGDDKLPSGGMEVYVDKFASKLIANGNIKLKIITRRFSGTKSHEKKGNIEVYRVPWVSGFYFRNLSFNFLSFCKSSFLDYDIILTNGLISTFFGIVLSFFRRKKVVCVPHGIASFQPQYPKFLRFVLRRFEKFVYTHVNYLVFLSDNERENFRKNFGLLPRKYEVVPTAIDFVKGNKNKIRKEFGLNKNIKVITFVGRLIEVKGVKYLIEAVKYIKNRNFIVLIVGSGSEEKELRYLVNKLKLNDKIKFLGFRNDVVDILACTNIYVLPSLSEGLPISLLEAKAAGCSCVVTDIGLPVKNGYDALVVPAKDSKELASALDKLLANVTIIRKIGENARKVVINYSYDKMIKKYIHIFGSL